MHKTLLAVAVAILAFLPLTAFAQDDDIKPPRFSFQGRVGALFAGGEPFENGATFEFGMMVRMASALHLTFAGGSSNFKGGTEPVPFTEEYAAFWESVLEQFHVLDPQPAKYRVSFGTLGVAFKVGTKRFEPYAVAGVGLYYGRFNYQFSLADIRIPLDYVLTHPEFVDIATIQDTKYLFGWNVGGGLNISINQIIGFGTQVTYHAINTEGLENQITATFGLNVNIP
jgi:opacity protein-like surface antigen